MMRPLSSISCGWTASILTSLLLSFTIVVQCIPEVRDWLWYRRGPFLSMLEQRMSLCAHDNLHAFANVRAGCTFVSFPFLFRVFASFPGGRGTAL